MAEHPLRPIPPPVRSASSIIAADAAEACMAICRSTARCRRQRRVWQDFCAQFLGSIQSASVRTRCGCRAGLAWMLLFCFATVAEARGKASRRNMGHGYELGPLKVTLLVFGMLAFVCGGGIAWCLYLECKPTAARIRCVMYCIVFALTTLELSLVASGDLENWMLAVILVGNIWGLLDAVIRFPIVHDFDTIFTLKQIALLIFKLIFYAFGFVDFYRARLYFFAVLLLNVIGLPLMYFLALPLEDDPADRQVVPDGVVDEDLLIRIYRLIAVKEDRQECVLGCRRRLRMTEVMVAQYSPEALSTALCALDPSLKRLVHEKRHRAV